MPDLSGSRPIALVTGASRRAGIAAAIAQRLAQDGWDVATTFWRAYDARMRWGSDPGDVAWLNDRIGRAGAKTVAIEADLGLPETVTEVFDAVEGGLGPVTALVLCHVEDDETDIVGTTVASFDRHFAVNARGSWLLIRDFGLRFRGLAGRGRIVGITSDHFVGSVPYGASKAALNRIVLAAAREFADRGITANLVEPGPTDTGWMNETQRADFSERNPQGRVGRPEDCANVVAFLCSPAGQWINGQIIHSNGGLYGRLW
jgi:3-oxoacyl-[acyl-carrier protein] reductase